MNNENKQNEDNKGQKNERPKVSNSTLIFLIFLCIAILIGDGILKNHNQEKMRELINDYPEYFNSTTNEEASLFTSSDRTISFSYPSGWKVEETVKDPLQIALYDPTTEDACVIVRLNEDLDPATRTKETADAYKRECEKYSDVTGVTKCTIANLPAVKKDFDITMFGKESSISIISVNVNGRLISLTENSASRVRLGKVFKTIEESFSINN